MNTDHNSILQRSCRGLLVTGLYLAKSAAADVLFVSSFDLESILTRDLFAPRLPVEPFVEDIGGSFGPYDLEISNQYLYWLESSNGRLVRANLLDGSRKILSEEMVFPLQMAITERYVYWSDGRAPEPDENFIGRCNLDGTDAVRLIPNLSWPRGIAVTDTHIYWTDFSDSTLSRASLEDPANTARVILRDLRGPSGLACHNGSLFWCERSGSRMRRYSLHNRTVEDVLSEGVENPRDIEVTDDWIYWTELDSGTVMRVDHRGEDPRVAMSGVQGARGLAVISNQVVIPQSGTPVSFEMERAVRLSRPTLAIRFATDSQFNYQLYSSWNMAFWRPGIYEQTSLFGDVGRIRAEPIAGTGGEVQFEFDVPRAVSPEHPGSQFFLVRRSPK